MSNEIESVKPILIAIDRGGKAIDPESCVWNIGRKELQQPVRIKSILAAVRFFMLISLNGKINGKSTIEEIAEYALSQLKEDSTNV